MSVWAPGLPSFQLMMTRRYRLHPYIRTFVAAWPLSLMGFAGRLLYRNFALKCSVHCQLCQPRSNLSCHHCVNASVIAGSISCIGALLGLAGTFMQRLGAARSWLGTAARAPVTPRPCARSCWQCHCCHLRMSSIAQSASHTLVFSALRWLQVANARRESAACADTHHRVC